MIIRKESAQKVKKLQIESGNPKRIRMDGGNSEDTRPDSRDDATECSSSFGCTQSKEESDPDADGFQQPAEIESELRDGNGAMSSHSADDDEMGTGNERGKKALNADWKKYRRGIEWRCRWLEVRLNELRSKAQKYDRLLEERRSRKAWLSSVQPGEESSARTIHTVDSPKRGQLMRRQRRKQVENTVDLDVYMARHPLFSRYDTNKKGERADIYVEAENETLQPQPTQNLVESERLIREESDTEEQGNVGRSTVGGQDSMEQILWKLEALQARVEKTKSQLSRGAPTQNFIQPPAISKSLSNVSRGGSLASPRISPLGTAPRLSGTKGRPPAGLSAAGLTVTPLSNGAPLKQVSAPLRRKSSDYDINNMVMPLGAGAKYVEHIKHADIWTPHWRLVGETETVNNSQVGSSSDEDTDDEQFENRHGEMELNERKHRYMLPPKKSPDGDPITGKGRSKSGLGKGAGKMSGRGKVPVKVVSAVSEEPPDSSAAFAGSIPKGKRRKRLFNATGFTTNRAQRLTAYVAKPGSTFPNTDVDVEGIHLEGVEQLEEQKVKDVLPHPEPEKSNEQPVSSADQAELKRKRSASSGLQVLANP